MTCNCAEPGQGILTKFTTWIGHTYDDVPSATPASMPGAEASGGGGDGMLAEIVEIPLPVPAEVVVEPTYLERLTDWLGGVRETFASMADNATRMTSWLDLVPWMLLAFVVLFGLALLGWMRKQKPMRMTNINNPTYNSPRYRGPFQKRK
jgi:hypothetical protein